MAKFTWFGKSALAIGVLSIAACSHGLFYQPHGMGSGSGLDVDQTQEIDLTFGNNDILWFGSSVDSLDVSSNGAVSTHDDSNNLGHQSGSWTTLGRQIMAPGFTYLQPPTDNSHWLNVAYDNVYDGGGDPSSVLAITWQDYDSSGNPTGFGLPAVSGAGTELSQLAIIRVAGTYNGINMQAGDVVFSYTDLPTSNGSFPIAIGITDGGVGHSDSSVGVFTAPGEPTNGVYNSPFNFGSVIPVGNGGIMLFRWDPNNGSVGGYDYIPTPEPATFVALGVGALALVRRRRKGA